MSASNHGRNCRTAKNPLPSGEGGRRPGEGRCIATSAEDPHPSAAPPPSPEGRRILLACQLVVMLAVGCSPAAPPKETVAAQPASVPPQKPVKPRPKVSGPSPAQFAAIKDPQPAPARGKP